ncbi:MAG: flap endonuclease [Planctomycetes bacterium]|nr:flap endonuclease [Planctomycetota bacterium]
MRVHVVDGTYELYRNRYGAPSAQTADGREVGAVRGLLRTLWSLLRGPEVTHVAAAFDTVIESFRNDLFAGYKTGEGIEPELWAQFPLAERATRALGITTWSMIDFETDDALATAAARFAADDRVAQVVLCTPDKDMAQCVIGDRVVMLDRRKQAVLDEAAVIAKFGVPPASIPDWLALVGDDADGIPGVPGWGALTSARMLSAVHHLEAIPRETATWPAGIRGAARLADSLFERFDDALLYRRLATLRTDVPLPESLAELEWRGVDEGALRTLCDEIEMPDSFVRTAVER